MSDINPPIAPEPYEDNADVGRPSGASTTAAAGQSAMPLRDRFWVIGPGALLLAFFWQPALKLIAPFILTSISSLLVTGLVLVDVAAKLSRRFRIGLYLVGAMLGMTGIGEAIYFTSLAVPVSDANDRHCLAIEEHMLSDTAGRAGDAAMFQALGCRPQGMVKANLNFDNAGRASTAVSSDHGTLETGTGLANSRSIRNP